MQAAFTVSSSDIVLDFFQTTSTLTVPFSDFQYKWHFLGVYREGAIGGYTYEGMQKQSSNSLTVAGSPIFTLLIGAAAGGSNPF